MIFPWYSKVRDKIDCQSNIDSVILTLEISGTLHSLKVLIKSLSLSPLLVFQCRKRPESDSV